MKLHHVLAFLCVFVGVHYVNAEDKTQIKIPTKFFFLNINSSLVAPFFKIENGEFVILRNGQKQLVKSEDLKRLDIKNAEGAFLLSTPIAITSADSLDISSLVEKDSTVRGCFAQGQFIMAREQRVESNGEVESIISLFKYKDSYTSVGSFKITSNPYNQSLRDVIALGGDRIGMTFVSSRHLYCNNFIIYDLDKKQPVGQHEFSLISVLNGKIISVVSPVPDSENATEILADFSKKSETLKIDQVELPKSFQDLANLKW